MAFSDFKFVVRYFYDKNDFFEIPLEGDDLQAATVSKMQRDNERKGSSEVTLVTDEGKTTYSLDMVRYWRIMPNPEYVSPEEQERRKNQKPPSYPIYGPLGSSDPDDDRDAEE